MKRISIVVIMLVVFCITANADYALTRGPDIGEIYFIGPTNTGNGIYRSIDFGETATCMDSTLNSNIDIMSIAADLTSGVLYGFSMPENLYISYSYGQQGSWVFRNSNISYRLYSGVSEGYLYHGFSQHSEDYGYNFIQHSYNGFFGQSSTSEIDVEQNIGYVRSTMGDSIYFFISYDNFENLEVQNQFNYFTENIQTLTRGTESGEIYSVGGFNRELRYSDNFGQSWDLKGNLVNYSGITGGKQPSELYVLASFNQFMGEIKHIYIYHSLDYGETFSVYHPFAYGPEPYYADFEAEPTSGTAPLSVQFTDLSHGDDIYAWEWDFNLDGIIDSYEQNPEYTYQDTGCYNVELKIYFYGEFRGYVKRNYIHVTAGNANSECKIENVKCKIQNYPNPFNPYTTISFSTTEDSEDTELNIYNMKGQLVNSFKIQNSKFKINSVVWDGKDDHGREMPSGVYLYQLSCGCRNISGRMVMIR